MLLHTTFVNTGTKKREYEKLCRFVTFFVVQVNNCDCKVCDFTDNVSFTVINYIGAYSTCLVVISRDIYCISTKNERKS